MVNRRMKYYGVHDLANYIYWDESLKKINQIDIMHCTEMQDLNDIIELYNIDAGYQHLSVEDKNKFSTTYPWLPKAGSLAKKYYSSFPIDKLVAEYHALEPDYVNDFWTLFENCKIYGKSEFTNDRFKELCNGSAEDQSTLRCVLQHLEIVRMYETYIVTVLDHSPITIDILCEQYEHDMKEYHLPERFSVKHWDKCVEKYLDRNDINPNVLKLIMAADFPVSSIVKATAKKRYDHYIESMRKNNGKGQFSQTVEIIFSPKQSEIVNVKRESSCLTFTYSLDYLRQTQSDESILCNFTCPFAFFDRDNRITLVSHKHEISVLESAVLPKASSHYKMGSLFYIKDLASLAQLTSYSQFLIDRNHSIESAITWFYNSYLSDAFKIRGFRIELLSENNSYYMRSQALVQCLESIVNQYKCYVRFGMVDWDYVEISQEPSDYCKIPSKIKDKYYYSNEKYCQNVMGYLFSDQTMLGYIKRLSLSCKNLYEAIENHDICIEDYLTYEQNIIKMLISKEILFVNQKGFLKWRDPLIVQILRNLYENDFDERTYAFGQRYQSAITELSSNNMIRFGSTLLSESEGEYFNFYLNTISFNNGPQLRNLYSHGKALGFLVKEHQRNYYLLLRLLVLITLKIKDELISVVDWGLGE